MPLCPHAPMSLQPFALETLWNGSTNSNHYTKGMHLCESRGHTTIGSHMANQISDRPQPHWCVESFSLLTSNRFKEKWVSYTVVVSFAHFCWHHSTKVSVLLASIKKVPFFLTEVRKEIFDWWVGGWAGPELSPPFVGVGHWLWVGSKSGFVGPGFHPPPYI